MNPVNTRKYGLVRTDNCTTHAYRASKAILDSSVISSWSKPLHPPKTSRHCPSSSTSPTHSSRLACTVCYATSACQTGPIDQPKKRKLTHTWTTAMSSDAADTMPFMIGMLAPSATIPRVLQTIWRWSSTASEELVLSSDAVACECAAETRDLVLDFLIFSRAPLSQGRAGAARLRGIDALSRPERPEWAAHRCCGEGNSRLCAGMNTEVPDYICTGSCIRFEDRDRPVMIVRKPRTQRGVIASEQPPLSRKTDTARGPQCE